MTAERLEYSGLNPFRATSLKSTILERIDSIKTDKNNAHRMNPSNAITVGEVILFSPFIAIYIVFSKAMDFESIVGRFPPQR